MFRVATSSDALAQANLCIAEAENSDDAYFLPKHREWIYNDSIIAGLNRNLQVLQGWGIRIEDYDGTHTQSWAVKLLRSRPLGSHQNFACLIDARLFYWTKKAMANCLSTRPTAYLTRFFPMEALVVIQRFSELGRLAVPAIGVSILKTLCNCWCTEARFGRSGDPCILGCADGEDNLLHYLVCQRLVGQFRRYFVGIPDEIWQEFPEFVMLAGREGLYNGDGFLYAGILANLALEIFNARKHGTNETVSNLICARLRFLARSHSKLRSTIGRMRPSTIFC